MSGPEITTLIIGTDHSVPIEPNGGSAVVTVDNAGGTVYYNNGPGVSAANNQGSIAPGGSATFTASAWIIGSGYAGVTVTVTSVYDMWANSGLPELTASLVSVSSPSAGQGPVYNGSGYTARPIATSDSQAPLSLKNDFQLNTSMSSANQTTGIQNAINAAISANRSLSIDYQGWTIDAPLVIAGALHLTGGRVLENWGPGTVQKTGGTYPQGSPPFLGSTITQAQSAADILQITASGVSVDIEHVGLVFGTPFINTGNGITAKPPNDVGGFPDYGVMRGKLHGVHVFGPDGNHYGFELTNQMYPNWDRLSSYGGGGLHYIQNSDESTFGNVKGSDCYMATFIGGSAHCWWFDGGGDFSKFGRCQGWVANVALYAGVSQPAGTTAPTSAQSTRKYSGSWTSQTWDDSDFESNVGSTANQIAGVGNSIPSLGTCPTVTQSGVAYTNPLSCPMLMKIPVVMTPPPSGEYLFWANNTTLNSVGRGVAGATPSSINERIVTGVTSFDVAVDSNYLYWADYANGAIGRANLDGSSPNATFITGLGAGVNGVAVNATNIFWTNKLTGDVGQATLAGGSVNTTFITGGNHPGSMTLDGTFLYWAEQNANTIGRATLAGGSVNHSFITGCSTPTAVAVNGSNIYWANYGTNDIGQATLAGGSVNQAFITGANLPFGVALDSTYVYWGNSGNGTIGQATLGGGSVTQTYITGANSPSGMAIGNAPATTATCTATISSAGPLGPFTSDTWVVPAGVGATTITLNLPVPSAGTYTLTYSNSVPGATFGAPMGAVGSAW